MEDGLRSPPKKARKWIQWTFKSFGFTIAFNCCPPNSWRIYKLRSS